MKKMNKYRTHASPENDTLVTFCGYSKDNPLSPTGARVTNDWDKVDCKRCNIKRRKDGYDWGVTPSAETRRKIKRGDFSIVKNPTKEQVERAEEAGVEAFERESDRPVGYR